jgi:hypothetical protein
MRPFFRQLCRLAVLFLFTAHAHAVIGLKREELVKVYGPERGECHPVFAISVGGHDLPPAPNTRYAPLHSGRRGARRAQTHRLLAAGLARAGLSAAELASSPGSEPRNVALTREI